MIALEASIVLAVFVGVSFRVAMYLHMYPLTEVHNKVHRNKNPSRSQGFGIDDGTITDLEFGVSEYTDKRRGWLFAI